MNAILDTSSTSAFVARLFFSAFTLYMMALLFRWVAPWLEMDPYAPRLRWLTRITDPLIHLMRRLLPPSGPVDWAPMAAILGVWVCRELVVGILAG